MAMVKVEKCTCKNAFGDRYRRKGRYLTSCYDNGSDSPYCHHFLSSDRDFMYACTTIGPSSG